MARFEDVQERISMTLTERFKNFLSGVLAAKRKIINIAFFMLVALNTGAMGLLATREVGRSVVGVFIIYFLQTIFFYAVPMYFAPLIIRREQRRTRRSPLLPRMIIVVAVFWMFLDQIGWLAQLLSKR